MAFFKRFARDVLYWSADITGRLQKREASMAGALTVLTYHRVLPDDEARACPFPALAMPESWFRAQMSWLKGNARVLPLDRALADLDAGPDRDPRPRIAVTFDDGYFDNFEVAAPVLKRCGLQATFFICTTPVRNASRLWYDSIAEGTLRWGSEAMKGKLGAISLGHASDAHAIVAAMKRAPDGVRRAAVQEVERQLGPDPWAYRSHVMTAEQIRALATAGHEIGSHTETHPILPELSASDAKDELLRSKAWLEETTEKPVTGFCYPNGDHTPATREWVAQAGYSYACLTEEGRHAPGGDRYQIRRIDVAPHRVGNCFRGGSERSFRAILSRLRGA
jgi:peptidoglycan/xylan/chitin deacetylase (PgdA/CDA1 family)